MIKIKMLMFAGLVALMFFTLTAGTMAFFSSEAISSGNTITAGTLFIGDEDDNKGVLKRFITLSGLIPGDAPKNFTVKVKNLGSMTANLNGISACITEGNEKFISNALKIQCRDSDGNILYRGSLLALDGNVVPLEEVVALGPGEITGFVFSVQLDERCGNWYKGKDIEFSLTVYAGQRPEQEVGGSVILVQDQNIQAGLNRAGPGDVVLIPAGSYSHLKVRPGVTVKAKDVVFDTVVAGFEVGNGNMTGGSSSNHGGQGSIASVQGFTITGSGHGVHFMNGHGGKISDNIFTCKGKAVLGSANVTVTRNDVTGAAGPQGNGNGVMAGHEVFQGGLDACYNLGDDLDPEENAL